MLVKKNFLQALADANVNATCLYPPHQLRYNLLYSYLLYKLRMNVSGLQEPVSSPCCLQDGCTLFWVDARASLGGCRVGRREGVSVLQIVNIILYVKLQRIWIEIKSIEVYIKSDLMSEVLLSCASIFLCTIDSPQGVHACIPPFTLILRLMLI